MFILKNDKVYFRRAVLHITIAATLFVALTVWMIRVDFVDWLYLKTRPYEKYELDEIIAVMFSLIITVCGVGIRMMYVARELFKKHIEDLKKLEHIREIDFQKQKLESIGQMASGVVHEVKNSLQPIIGLGEIIRDNLAKHGEEKMVSYMKTILESAEYASMISRKILAFSQKDTKLECADVDLYPVIDRVLDFVGGHIAQTIEIKRLYSDHPEDFYVCIDTKALVPIFMNLLINSSESMNGEGTVTVDINTTSLEDFPDARREYGLGQIYVRISVSDTGAGISPDDLPFIFDPFFSTKSGEGHNNTGLGLSTVYALVRDMNGYIRAESKIGEGTTFYIYFPLSVNKH